MDLGSAQLQAGFEKFSKLPKQYRVASYLAIVATVVGLYGYLLYIPKHNELERAKAKQFELQRKLNEVRSVAANMETFEEEIAALEKKLAVALRQLPDSKELPVLLTDITSLGKNSGLEFKAFRPRSEELKEFYAEVPIEIEFQGRFHDIALFFDRVAKLPRIVNVSELDMKIDDETAQETMLSVKGSAKTFRFVEVQQASPETKKKGGQKKGRQGKAQGGGEA